MSSRTGLVLALIVGIAAAVFAVRSLRTADPQPADPQPALSPAPADESAPVRTESTRDDPKPEATVVPSEAPQAAPPAGEEVDEEFAQILAALNDPSGHVRERAVLAVGERRDPALVDLLAAYVRDPDPDVREALVKALAKMRSPQASALLVELLADEDPDVVEDAIQALISADHKAATPRLRQIAKSEDPFLATRAARALVRFGDDAAADEVASRMARGLESPSVTDRRQAVLHLKLIGGAGVLPYLHKAQLDPDKSVQREVQRALIAVRASMEES